MEAAHVVGHVITPCGYIAEALERYCSYFDFKSDWIVSCSFVEEWFIVLTDEEEFRLLFLYVKLYIKPSIKSSINPSIKSPINPSIKPNIKISLC